MPDYDLGVLGLTSPPALSRLQTYRPAVLCRNNGVHAATGSGFIRIYSAADGRLVWSDAAVTPTLEPGQEGDALANSYWTPEALGHYIVNAYITTYRDRKSANNTLPPTKIEVLELPPEPEPIVPFHATQHRRGAKDELIVEGLHGRLADGQPTAPHAPEHGQHGLDKLDVTGLSGLLATHQTPTLHALSHGPDAVDSLMHGNELHAPAFALDSLVEKLARKDQPSGYAGLSDLGLVDTGALGLGDAPSGTYLSGIRTWMVPPRGGPSIFLANSFQFYLVTDLEVLRLSNLLIQSPDIHEAGVAYEVELNIACLPSSAAAHAQPKVIIWSEGSPLEETLLPPATFPHARNEMSAYLVRITSTRWGTHNTSLTINTTRCQNALGDITTPEARVKEVGTYATIHPDEISLEVSTTENERYEILSASIRRLN